MWALFLEEKLLSHIPEDMVKVKVFWILKVEKGGNKTIPGKV